MRSEGREVDHFGFGRRRIRTGSHFHLAATELGVRAAGADYDGRAALATWLGFQRMIEGLAAGIFPPLTKGCDRLEDFLRQL